MSSLRHKLCVGIIVHVGRGGGGGRGEELGATCMCMKVDGEGVWLYLELLEVPRGTEFGLLQFLNGQQNEMATVFILDTNGF